MGPPPVVTGISPKDGPPGTRVTIRGEFLGTGATDLIGLKICGCDCQLSAEWKSKNKIVARSGPCKGLGDIIVTTRSGGVGTSTVQFRGYHETVGPVKESAVWVEESTPPSLPWGRRPMSPASYTPPDPLGLSTEGDECKFPEEELNELFPDCSGNLSEENFHPVWYLLEHHSNASLEDLKAGLVFLQRKVESEKDVQLTFLKANTGAVMDQLDRLLVLKNMFEDDQRKNGREPLPGLKAAIEESITLADSLFSEILARKESADKTKEALALLTRHKFLFQLPSSIDNNIKRKEYDLVVNDYTRVKNLFGSTDVKLFQKILSEIDKKINDLRDKLYERTKTLPINIQEQRKFIRLLISLNWEDDAAWAAVNARKQYFIQLMNKLKDHFKKKEELEGGDKGKRKKDVVSEGEWSVNRSLWCMSLCGAATEELTALWTLARWYFAGDLGGTPSLPNRHDHFKEMIISSVEVFAAHMRTCLLTGSGTPSSTEALKSRLTTNLTSLRESYDALVKLDLPSQPLSIVDRVLLEYRIHGMTVFLQRAHQRVKGLAELENWKVDHYSQYGAITALPHLLEKYMSEALSSIHKCVAIPGRRESPLLSVTDANNVLQQLTQRILLAYVAVLQELPMNNSDQEFNTSTLSQALDQKVEDTLPLSGDLGDSGPSCQQRPLISAANAQYTRRVILNNIAAVFESYEFPKPITALQATRDALSKLEANIAEMYLENKGDPLVGTIEPSMYMGRYDVAQDAVIDDARPYVYEIINNLIAVHAEVDAVCGTGTSGYVSDICETVCEEVCRLGDTPPPHRAAALQARVDYTLLQLACTSHLTNKAENFLKYALSNLPPLDHDETKHMEKLVAGFRKRMELQLASLNCNMETV